MKVMLDTNVVLDILANRKPFAKESAEAIARAEHLGWQIAITANTITDLYFVLRKHLADGRRTKSLLLGMVERVIVVDTTREICLKAFKSPVADFEDAILVESAVKWCADWIITRNTGDFLASPVPAILPARFISLPVE